MAGCLREDRRTVPALRAARDTDRTGLTRLSISQRSCRSLWGVLRVRDLPGKGCIFTIDLPRHFAPAMTRQDPLNLDEVQLPTPEVPRR